MLFRHSLSRRDVLVLLLGAGLMYIWSLVYPLSPPDSITINTHLSQFPLGDVNPILPLGAQDKPKENPPNRPTDAKILVDHIPPARTHTTTKFTTKHATVTVTKTSTVLPEPTSFSNYPTLSIPETTIVEHAPGWTVFRNLYMSQGILYIVTSKRSSFPEIRLMTSTGLPAENVPGNEAAREPTSDNMAFLTPEEAQRRWGGDASRGQANRIWAVEGNTLLFNDPRQFLRHYYHFVAELFFGTWAFWTGTFQKPSFEPSMPYLTTYPSPPPVHRAIFAHSNADGWRDNPGFNSYFLRAAFPSLTVEMEEDWRDRIITTIDKSGNGLQRAWHFPLVLLADRSAAFRGVSCGSQTQRTASEAWEAMSKAGKLPGVAVGGWWEPMRSAVLRFAGVTPETTNGGPRMKEVMAGGDIKPITELPMPEKIVITYISRQRVNRRKLLDEDHAGLVLALQELVDRKGNGWELQVLEAEKMTQDEQVRAVSRSTVMLGVHGNGLTHLVLMPPTRVSTVIEIFYPGGFAHDYQWTAIALGMKHFAMWNDTHYTLPNKPKVDYPEGFQENYIPVHGPSVAQLIEDRIEGKL